MPELNAVLRKKNEELKAQIDILTDELKKLETQFTVHTNHWQPTFGLCLSRIEESQECLEFLSVKMMSSKHSRFMHNKD